MERIMAADRLRQSQMVAPEELVPGMILEQDLMTLSGVKLVARGFEVNPALCRRLANFLAIGEDIARPIRVALAGEG
jgi:hypothetical protein